MYKMIANKDLELPDGQKIPAGAPFVAPNDDARKAHEGSGDARAIDADPNPPPRTERRRENVKAAEKARDDAEPAKADASKAAPKPGGKE